MDDTPPQKTIRDWLSQFKAAAARGASATALANDLAMWHFGARIAQEEPTALDTWIARHSRMIDRALIRVVKNARKWSAVRAMLIANKDGDEMEVYYKDFHPMMLASLAQYERRERRERRARRTQAL